MQAILDELRKQNAQGPAKDLPLHAHLQSLSHAQRTHGSCGATSAPSPALIARADVAGTPSEPAVTHVLATDREPIVQFLRPSSGDVLSIHVLREDEHLYVGFMTTTKGRAVLYTLDDGRQPPAIVNHGHGVWRNDGWDLWHKDADGRIFESHGGVGTLETIDRVLTRCRHQTPVDTLTWR